jgi:hypothetical protein
VASKQPKWFEGFIKNAAEIWEDDSRIYALHHSDGRWRIDFCDKDGKGGGGTPWMNKADLEAYVQRHRINRLYRQGTLGL